MIFISRCLRTKDIKHPLDKRCKNGAATESVLCKDCMAEAKKGPIDILMHNDVTKQFGIKFKNQLTVRINFAKTAGKPDSHTTEKMKLQNIKLKLHNDLMLLPISRLKYIHDELNLKIWKILNKAGDIPYKVKYQICQEIICKLAELSIG